MSKLYLAVDGGQSSTTALIGDESGRIVGFGRGGPCNHVGASEGRAKFLSAIGGTIREASQQAGSSANEFVAACLGFSGGPADKEPLVRELISSEHLLVTHDALIGFVGACAGEPGVMTIAGTGSIAFGRNAANRSARAGGWGYIFGDEGGAFDIVRQALRASLRFEEGWGPATALRSKLLEANEAPTANDLLHWFYTAEYPRARVAKLARLIDDAAAEGDAVAQQIIDRAARELAGLASAVRAQLFVPGETARMSYVGGVFHSRRLLAQFQMLLELEEGNEFRAPIFNPAAGALIEAYRIAGLRPELKGLPESEK